MKLNGRIYNNALHRLKRIVEERRRERKRYTERMKELDADEAIAIQEMLSSVENGN